ncbi:MAG TPA: amylo-alpha-1,6-glucosidase [Tepidisphaeraceae bacterium]|nr:amylo-alpha-1,6-glucosidase [Tepidisphaeraceae bacterium]
MASYAIHTAGELNPHLEREWLLTNGAGAFAMGSILGCNTRRYHGLLCAATLGPLGRIMTLNRVAEQIEIDGLPSPIDLSANCFGSSVFPQGYAHLERFEKTDVVAWTYIAHGVQVRKELQLLWMKNTIALRYTIDPGAHRKLVVRLRPFVSMRDFHAVCRRADGELEVTAANQQARVKRGGHEVTIRADRGKFVHELDWWYEHTYPIETRRGLPDREDLFTPGSFVIEITEPTTITLHAGTDLKPEIDWDAELKRRASSNRIKPAPTPVQQQLFEAAGDFIVARSRADGSAGATILAGYPWFADWGRDTMISLPGLLLTTGRFDQAGQVLSVFAGVVSEGMIPNLFDDYTNEPHYNTVDASLWFVHACHEYLRITKDRDTFETQLLPACRQIVAGYRKGTRFDIRMDDDGLIRAGDHTTQLTWMDAKCGDTVFTPREGKAVEINALWYNALRLLGENELADRVKESFVKAFWISPFRGLADVLHDDGTRDSSIRPNQIFATSLPHSPLSAEQSRAVLEVVRRELLTPVGLRTLSVNDPKYQPSYLGNQFDRDKAYHNGTIWPWLIGHFLEGYLKAHDRSPEARRQAREWLSPLIREMQTNGCVGSIAEIYEAATQRPDGCPAQAWSVAEVLRLAVELEM